VFASLVSNEAIGHDNERIRMLLYADGLPRGDAADAQPSLVSNEAIDRLRRLC
jgi:hypothetical protein